jgi:carboxypeptidase family protein
VITHRLRVWSPSCEVSSFCSTSRLSILWVVISLLYVSGVPCTWAGADKDQGTRKPYALIVGTVWSPDDHPLYGVKIKIRRADQKRSKWQLYSDHHGEFALRVPAGRADYLVSADLSGYKPLNGRKLQAGQALRVHIENDERTDIGLHLSY